MKKNDIKKLSSEERHKKLEKSKLDYVKLMMQHSAQELKDTSLISKVKKNIARLNTENNRIVKG
jgi:ribosomal protein L29